MQGQREEPTLDVRELDRVAWNLPVASKRPSGSHPQPSAKSEREVAHQAGPGAPRAKVKRTPAEADQ